MVLLQCLKKELGVTPGDLANPKLTWERSEQIDLGVDLTVLTEN
jgi:hypothetical protein